MSWLFFHADQILSKTPNPDLQPFVYESFRMAIAGHNPPPSAVQKINLVNLMNSKELAQYMEATNGITKPWLLLQLRLKKLQERRALISENEYVQELEDIFQDSINLGEWWRGIEHEVF